MEHSARTTQISLSSLGTDLTGADYGYRTAEVRAGLRVLDERLDHLARLTAADRDSSLVVVDGPFAGEVGVALATASRWMQRARDHLAYSLGALDNAHTALSGLASEGHGDGR